MRTQKQIECSRLNGAKSRGPRSSEGKQISSQNSFKTGLHSQSLVTLGEKLEDFEALRDEYYRQHSPQTPEERETLDVVIRLAWQLRRYAIVETHLWNQGVKQAEMHTPSDVLDVCLFGSAFFGNDQKFARLHRIQASTQRQFHDNLRHLERLKAVRPTESIEAQPVEDETTSADLGFVPSECGVGASTPPPGFRPAQSGSGTPPQTTDNPRFVPSTFPDSVVGFPPSAASLP